MTNPNSTRITTAMWNFWGQFQALEPSAEMGGIYANKPGYHNYRNALPSSDYSRRDVAADREGPGDKASAVDLTMSKFAMVKYTTRLDVAARAKDVRLYIDGIPIIREFIGTKNNTDVYCYVLTGGKPLGVGHDAGSDPGRDISHLWHLHLSVIRKFCANEAAMNQLLSLLSGETVNAWKERNSIMTPDEMAQISDMVVSKLRNMRFSEDKNPDGTFKFPRFETQVTNIWEQMARPGRGFADWGDTARTNELLAAVQAVQTVDINYDQLADAIVRRVVLEGGAA